VFSESFVRDITFYETISIQRLPLSFLNPEHGSLLPLTPFLGFPDRSPGNKGLTPGAVHLLSVLGCLSIQPETSSFRMNKRVMVEKVT